MMKVTRISFAFLLAMSFVLMTGCAKEQSSISMDDLTKSAQIVGRYTYDEGQEYSVGSYSRLIKPAAGVKVEVTINASEISSTADAKGVITYETTTDDNGRYEITIPVTESGINVTVQPVDFKGMYYSVEGISAGKPVYSEQEVVYSAAPVDLFLTPNAIEVNDGMYTHTTLNLDEGYPYTSVFNVVVGEASYSKKTDADGIEFVHKEYKPKNGVDVEIEVEYEDGTFLYVATTDMNGVAKFSIPTNDKNWNANITANAKSYVVNKFTYYKSEYSEDFGENIVTGYNIDGGIFEQESAVSKYVSFDDLSGKPAPEFRVKMNFEPFSGNETYGYSVSDWYGVNF